MKTPEHYRLATSCGTSLTLHALALGAATYVVAPQLNWETNVARGRSSVIVLSLPSQNSPAVADVVQEIEPFESESDSEPDPRAVDSTTKRSVESTWTPPSIEIGDPLVETSLPSETVVGERPRSDEPTLDRLEPPSAARPKRERVQPFMIAAATPSKASPDSSVAPSGADFDVPPSKLPENEPPDYPPEARAAGHEGRVTVLVLVNDQGVVTRLSVERSSGFHRLDQAALEAVRQWRFAPAQKQGRSVAAEILVPVRFSIRGSSI